MALKSSEDQLTWSFEELQEYLLTLTNYRHVSTNLKFMKQNIIEKTQWLDEFYKKDIPFSLRVNAIRDGIFTVENIPVCGYCDQGNKVLFLKQNGTFSKCCSNKCSHTATMENSKKKSLEKYGTEYHIASDKVKNKAKQTFIERYGVDHQCKVKEVREKINQTNIKKYGGVAPAKSQEIMDKIVETNMERYGVKMTLQNEDVKKKARVTMLERYGHEYFTATDEFKQHIKDLNMERYGRFHHTQKEWSDETYALLENKEWMAQQYEILGGHQLARKLGVDGTTIYDRLNKHGIPINQTLQSAAERQVNEFIMSLGFDTIQSDRSILGGKELDIVIPEKKIAIEYNGLFWHSFPKRPKNYHKEKTDATNAAGYRLIHIFEDEWKYQQEQMKNKLKSILGVDDRPVVYARKCEVVDMTKDKTKVKDFYNEHHVQGNGGQSLVFALVEEGIPVAMMSFKRRSSVEYDLVRYATSKRVVGGFSKLLKASKKHLKELGVEFIVSFADKRYSDGNMYLQNGWEHVYDTKPDYQYVIEDMRVRKQNFRRKILEEKLPNFNPDESEMVNMLKHEIFPIYDCGLMKFKMDL